MVVVMVAAACRFACYHVEEMRIEVPATLKRLIGFR